MKNSLKDADLRRGERAAQRVLKELDVRHPAEFPIEDIVYLRGPLVRDIPLDGTQGRLARIGDKAIISVNADVWYQPRRRFIIAHELGHFEIHDEKQNQLELCDEDINERYDAGTEREANAFAAEFLMPSALWKKRVDVKEPSLDVVAQLAKEFQVSFTAAAIRFVKLNPERCAAAFVRDGIIQWVAYSTDFRHWVTPQRRVSKYSSAHDFTAGSTVPNREHVTASEWLESNRIARDDDLIEFCRPIPSLNATLSILWIPADADY